MDTWSSVWGVVAALLPTAGLLYLFWVVMTHIVEADRRERAAQRAWEAAEDAAAANEQSGGSGDDTNPH